MNYQPRVTSTSRLPWYEKSPATSMVPPWYVWITAFGLVASACRGDLLWTVIGAAVLAFALVVWRR